MNQIPLTEKIKFTFLALKKNKGVLLLSIPFILIGTIVIYIAPITDATTFLYVFGGVFILVPIIIIIFTLPSSFLYYYKQILTKKYGYRTKGMIIKKEIEDTSYTERIDNRIEKIEEFNYLITYTYVYKKNEYTNSFYADTKELFDSLKINNQIPIKFLKTNPNNSSVIIKSINF